MTALLIPGGKRLVALRALLDGEPVAQVAHQVGLDEGHVETLAADAGWPDRKVVARTVTSLQAAVRAAGAPAPRPPAPPVAAPPRGLTRVQLTDLHPDPDNPREELTDIEGLAETITSVGLIQPIVAQVRRGGGFQIVAGHRRHAALQLLGWPHTDILVRQPMRSDAVLATMLIENGQRAGLDPMEEARALQRLKTLRGLNDAELGRLVGRSQPIVSARLALLLLTPEQQDEVRAKRMSVIEAASLARKEAGTTRSKRPDSTDWHLGPSHDLAHRAKTRCQGLGHKRGRIIGGMACGACWEQVVRIDERHQAQTKSATAGACVTCGTPHSSGAAS